MNPFKREPIAFTLRWMALLAVALVVPACGDGKTGAQGPPGPPGSAVTSVTAGNGLVGTPNPIVSTGTLSVDFAGTGTATTASRSDHHHDGSYLSLTGGTLTGGLTVGGILTGDGSGLSSLNAANLGSGTVPDGRLGGSYTSPLTLTNAANTFTGTFTLGAPVTRIHSIPSWAFRPTSSGGLYTMSTGLYTNVGTTMVAPVQLPQGAQITQVVASIRDDYDNGNATFILVRWADTDGTMVALAGAATSTFGTNPAIVPVTANPVGATTFPIPVANDTHSYGMIYTNTDNPGNLIQLYRVRIDYTITTPLP